MRLFMKKYFKYIAVIITVFAADFFSKAYLLGFFANKWGDLIGGDYGLSNLFNIHFIWNRGVSFSAFNFVMPIILSVLTALIVLWLLYYLFKKSDVYERMPLAMIIGGAFGNLVDRISFGAVADFIQWHIGGFWTFPAIFNVGDIFITFGVILYLINMFINRRKCLRNLGE